MNNNQEKEERVEVKTYIDRGTGDVTKVTANGIDIGFQQKGAVVFFEPPMVEKNEDLSTSNNIL